MEAEATLDQPTPSPSRARKALRIAGWSAFAVASLLFFTLLKLPEDRIGQLVLGTLNQALQSGPMPLEIQAQRTRISLLPLPGVKLDGLTLKTRDASGRTQRVRWHRLQVSPSLLDLVMGRLGGSVRITVSEGSAPALVAAAWTRGDAFSLDLSLADADLGESGLGLLTVLANIGGSVPFNGKVQLSGKLQSLKDWKGAIQLSPGKIDLPAQRVMGFPIPALVIRGGEIRAAIGEGKARIESFKLGKPGEPGDDLSGQLSGEVTLGQAWDSSQLNLKAQVKFSEAVLKALFLVDALLSPAKTGEGSYSFQLQGPAYAPNLLPAGAN